MKLGTLAKRSYGVPLESFLRRRRVRSILLAVSIPLILLAAAWADHHSLLLYQGDEFDQFDHKTFRVDHVIDGDTIDIIVPDRAKSVTPIRLLGINAPEIAHPWLNANPGHAFGEEAANFARQLCDGKDVMLVLERSRTRERFGRILAYVVLPDGSSMNEAMIANGLARADSRWSHKDLERYDMIEQLAQHQGVGMWRKREPTMPGPGGEPE